MMKRMQILSLVLLFLVISGITAAPSVSAPRKSPDFTINEASGKQIQLSSFKGKVIMIEFFFLRSPSCLDLAQTMNKLNADLGSRGFQPIAIAFPAPQSDANAALVGNMAEALKLSYPVGYTNKEDVDTFLNRGKDDMLRIPQVVIIDRAGMIRAQTGGRDGNRGLENENYLRTVLDGLLKEPSPGKSAKK